MNMYMYICHKYMHMFFHLGQPCSSQAGILVVRKALNRADSSKSILDISRVLQAGVTGSSNEGSGKRPGI